MQPKASIKHCHVCKHYLPPDTPAGDPLCALAAENKALTGYPILQAVRFQRSSGFLTDCGPGGQYWEAAL